MDDLKIKIEPCQEGTLQRNYTRCIGKILKGRMEEYSPRDREHIYHKLMEELQKDD